MVKLTISDKTILEYDPVKTTRILAVFRVSDLDNQVVIHANGAQIASLVFTCYTDIFADRIRHEIDGHYLDLLFIYEDEPPDNAFGDLVVCVGRDPNINDPVHARITLLT